MGQEREPEQDVGEGQGDVLADGPEVAPLGDAVPRGNSPISTGSADGMATVTSTKAVHSRATSVPSVQAATRVASVSGDDSVRRRLSIIFQRAMPWIELW